MTAGLEILNLHAQGGMAEVYRARAVDDRGRTWHYAVKRMLPELLKEPEMMRMFIEEQRVAACLVHPNIVRVYDVAQAETAEASDTFIVMEFLEGRDLSEVIEAAELRKKTLPVWFCIHVCREVLKALDYATTQAKDKSGRVLGLIHRDISPHNIFICKDGQVKLTDFGVAKVETAEVRTKAGVIKGKFGYMSPEQLMAGQLDFRSDLYNVGILLFEALTSKRLFFGETATQFIAAMMTNEVPPLDKRLLVPPELDALMRRSLSKKREERPQTARAFEAALAQIAQQYTLEATEGHLAGEMASLFPALVVPEDAVFQAPAVTSPDPRPPTRAQAASRVMAPAAPPASLPAATPSGRPPTKARVLTFVSQAPKAPVEDPAARETYREDPEPVPEEDEVTALSEVPTRAPTPRPSPPSQARAQPSQARAQPSQARAQPSQVQAQAQPPSARAQPSQARAQPSQARPQPSQARADVPVPAPKPATGRAHAPVAAPPPAVDDENIATVVEALDLRELGLRPDEPPSEEEYARTEPTRLPAFIVDPPSTTAPGRGKAGAGSGAPQEFLEELDDLNDLVNAPTAETARPGPAPGATPHAPGRVSTGSRRVVSLTDEAGKPPKRR